jgi:hypothetical protein
MESRSIVCWFGLLYEVRTTRALEVLCAAYPIDQPVYELFLTLHDNEQLYMIDRSPFWDRVRHTACGSTRGYQAVTIDLSIRSACIIVGLVLLSIFLMFLMRQHM